jgi:hypothetical protein
MLAYNCSPSCNWRRHLDDDTIAHFQRELGAMGYAFQSITLAGFHALNHSMFDLARGYAEGGMTAYVALQEREFAAEAAGYTAVVGAGQRGAGIAEVCARAGCEMLVVEQNRIALEAGRDRILSSLDRAARSGKRPGFHAYPAPRGDRDTARGAS